MEITILHVRGVTGHEAFTEGRCDSTIAQALANRPSLNKAFRDVLRTRKTQLTAPTRIHILAAFRFRGIHNE